MTDMARSLGLSTKWVENLKNYILSRKTKIYLLNGLCITLPKFTKVTLYDNGFKEVVVKLPNFILLCRRRMLDENFNPVEVYINGDLVGLCNYKDPPFPISLLY